MNITNESSMWSRIEKTDTCWVWTGFRDKRGYGKFWVNKRGSMFAHRLVYELIRGEIPSGLELDHLCRNPSCVNPDHLEPVTHRENCKRGSIGEVTKKRFAQMTHCKHGHEFSGENIKTDSKGHRKCIKCSKNRDLIRSQNVEKELERHRKYRQENIETIKLKKRKRLASARIISWGAEVTDELMNDYLSGKYCRNGHLKTEQNQGKPSRKGIRRCLVCHSQSEAKRRSKIGH